MPLKCAEKSHWDFSYQIKLMVVYYESTLQGVGQGWDKISQMKTGKTASLALKRRGFIAKDNIQQTQPP